MFRIENPRVIAAIVDCLNLPINRRCELIFVESNEAIFILDEYTTPQLITRVPMWAHLEIRWWGAELTVSHPMDIGHWEIDCKTGKSRWVCCYNTEGKIKYGRYYEPSMD